jgi:hypothetical protein
MADQARTFSGYVCGEAFRAPVGGTPDLVEMGYTQA